MGYVGKVVLPAGFAPATVSFEASCSNSAELRELKLDAPLGFAPRFTVSETVVLLLHYRANATHGSKCLSGYRCCPGLGLFTKEVPKLLGQAGKIWAHPESHRDFTD